MAVCEIWDVKGRLDHPIDYAENPEKTANPKYTEADLQALVDVMEYATNKDKTEKRFFVTGVNCDTATARDEMMIAKAEWNDESEIVCYHGFQSFKHGEVTPEVAHEVGVKLAEKMWGDRFQVIVATHLNTECLHNHFVVNSVSFLDGKHYHDNKANLRLLRQRSDELCREYALSVIEHPSGKKKPYALYSPLVKAMQGEVVHISATSENHINAMDMNSDYGDGANPVILKSEFILSLCEQLIGGASLGAKQKSIIDRCTASVYRYYQQGNYQGTPPTLQDFREELLKQDEPEAKEIALAIELFTDGSLNTFAKHTNVDTHSRLICYDILDLGKQLQPIGMLVVLDSILNRITQNRAKGRNTFIFIDEIYLLFQHEYSANFLFTLWKRVRKYGAYCTGITQNVDDLLQSHTARTMLANSEFIIMLNQASTDRIELAKLLNISDLQMSYITNVGAGQGLLKVGSSLVPFVNKFPRNTELYRLMTTKFGEV